MTVKLSSGLISFEWEWRLASTLSGNPIKANGVNFEDNIGLDPIVTNLVHHLLDLANHKEKYVLASVAFIDLFDDL
jgi:hypothetical protein